MAACFSGSASLCAEQISNPQWNWDSAISFATEHFVLPVLLRKVKCLGIANLIPPEILDVFSAAQNCNAERNRFFLNEVRKITSILNEQGIEPIALKGVAHILSGLYGHLSERYMRDIDLLIPDKLHERAIEILLSKGYSCTGPHRETAWGWHHYPAITNDGGVLVEIHHKLGMGVCGKLLTTLEIANASKRVNFEGVTLRLPCPEHLIIHYIAHSELHHAPDEQIWPSMRSVYDFTLLNDTYGTPSLWQEIRSRFRTFNQTEALELCMLEVRRKLGGRVVVDGNVTLSTRILWTHRSLLRRVPWLRFIDPYFRYLSLILPRLRRLNDHLSVPGGRRYLLRALFRKDFYVSLVSDFRV